MKMRKLMVSVLLLLTLALVGGSISAQSGVTGYVVHGVPGLVVDVYIDGALVLEDFQPGTIVGPLVGPANTPKTVAIVPANGDPASPAIQATLTGAPGSNISIVAHLDENGAPTASVFENDFSATHGDNARVIVRHTAAAPAVDALFFPGTPNQLRVGPLSNGEQTVAELAPGSYTVGLAPAGTDTVVFGPATDSLAANRAYVVYFIGSLSGGSFTYIYQNVPVA
jgi:hypothetical protein